VAVWIGERGKAAIVAAFWIQARCPALAARLHLLGGIDPPRQVVTHRAAHSSDRCMRFGAVATPMEQRVRRKQGLLAAAAIGGDPLTVRQVTLRPW
jgi:hypothetical protein